MEQVNQQQLQTFLDLIAELGIERTQFDNLMKSEKFLELLKHYAVSHICSLRGYVDYRNDFDEMLASANIFLSSEEIRGLAFTLDISDDYGRGRGVIFEIFYYNRSISNEDVIRDLKTRGDIRPGTIIDLLALFSCLTEEDFPQKGNIVAPASRVVTPTYDIYPFLKWNCDTKKWELHVESFLKPGPLKSQQANQLWSKDFYFLSVGDIRK